MTRSLRADLEADLERYFRLQVRKAGGSMHELVPVDVGIPDRLVILPWSQIFLVEVKTATGELRPKQKVWHAKAAQKGVIVVVLHGREEVDAWLAQVTGGTGPST